MAAMGATIVLFVAALGVRAIPGDAPTRAEDRPREVDELREPMQLLGRSAALRIAELDPRISEPQRSAWLATRRRVFELQGCPKAAEWLDSPDGQAFERHVGELRRGTREDALAALALSVELARRTEWTSGLLRRNPDAERIASLLADWLRTWAGRAPDDTLLGAPTQAATALYAHVMQIAGKRLLGRDEALDESAVAFLSQHLRDPRGQPTALARGLDAAHPAALRDFGARKDSLAGLDGLARQLFPGLDGECE